MLAETSSALSPDIQETQMWASFIKWLQHLHAGMARNHTPQSTQVHIISRWSTKLLNANMSLLTAMCALTDSVDVFHVSKKNKLEMLTQMINVCMQSCNETCVILAKPLSWSKFAT
jgi:hypothetical protein